MAITPKELTAITAGDNKVLEAIEAEVDAALREGFTGQGAVCIDVPNRVRYGDKLYRELIRRYSAAGWNVKYESDQRDGDCLSFIPRGGQR